MLLITAYSQKEFVEKSKQDNIIGYLVKPVSEASLIPAVIIALQQAKRTQTLKQSIQLTQEQIQKQKMIERAKGQRNGQ
ncbi:ANTAR domain-containing response regulator [Lysinibacillus xylanilyticus]|uniref:ANTAR domain-containing response regulator n=1 Tax=Lysinibacillus xylanilyticus TaxID=582475 RepID=UPI003D006F52